MFYPEMIDIGCFSHTIDRVDEHFKTPYLHEFEMYQVNLFSHSPKTRLQWREETSRDMPSYSPTRWWSRWEMFYPIMVQFGDVEPFIHCNEDIAPATKAMLLSFFTDNKKNSKLKMELAIIVDYGEIFVKATYRIRQNIRGGKLSWFINNMHYVGKTFAVCRLKLRARLCNVDFRVCTN